MDYIALCRIATYACLPVLTLWGVADRAEAESPYRANSTLYVTDGETTSMPVAPETHSLRSNLVFHRPSSQPAPPLEVAADAPPPAAPNEAAGRATLTVVSNADNRQPLRSGNAVFVEDSSVAPARYRPASGSGAHRDRPTWSSSKEAQRTPSNFKIGGIAQPSSSRSVQATDLPAQNRPQSELIVRATDDDGGFPSTQDPRRAKQTRMASINEAALGAQGAPLDAASQWLVEAHELSQHASREADYSRIVTLCAKAIEAGVSDVGVKYARTLSAWALNRRGQLRNDEGQYDLAMADFQTSLEADPDNWRALHNRAVTYAQNGDFAEAFDDFSRVIQLSPQFPKAYSNRATLYVQASQPENALSDFDRALELDPDLFAALVGRGRICHQIGRLHEALESLNAAVEIDGENAEVVCSRADLYADLGNYTEALTDYARAIDLQPDFAHAYRNGAWLLATCPDERFRDAENAVAGAKQALEFGYGQRHSGLDTLAAALASAGRFEEAVSTIQQAIEVAPEESRGAYEVRLRLYETRQPFRISPVEVAQASATAPALH